MYGALLPFYPICHVRGVGAGLVRSQFVLACHATVVDFKVVLCERGRRRLVRLPVSLSVGPSFSLLCFLAVVVAKSLFLLSPFCPQFKH